MGIKAANDGHFVVPAMSIWGYNKYNAEDTLDHYKTNAKADSVKGFMTAPWESITLDNVDYFLQSFREMKEAKDKIYG